MSTEPVVRIDDGEPGIKKIVLNRPERRNAMSAELMTGIYDALDTVAADNLCEVVILTGEGRGFCSGLDLEDQGMIPGIDGCTIPRMAMKAIEHFSGVVPAMRRIPQPIICAINGPAYGGGMCLGLGADIRYAAESATFNSTGIVNGLTSTEMGVSWLLPRLIGASRSNEFLLSGRVMDAKEAEQVGLVSKTLPDEELQAYALATAQRMVKFSTHGVQMTKQALWAALETPGFEAAIEMENRNQILLGQTVNLEECIRARRADRKPVYTDEPRDWYGNK